MAKTGRKRKTGKREPNGRISRKGEADKIKSVGIQARQRHFGMTEDEAKKPLSTDPVGLLRRCGEIDEHQYQAAVQYEEDVRKYRAAMGLPKGVRAMEVERIDGRALTDEEEQAIKAKAHIKRYNLACDAVRQAQEAIRNEGNLFGALETIVIRQVNGQWRMIGDLRIALNALVRHYGLNRRAA